MKKLFTLFAAAIVAVTMCAKTAESGSCGTNLTWAFNASTGVLTIAGTGPMTDYSADNLAPWYAFNDKVTSLSIVPGITTIGDYAFYLLSKVGSADIPEGVTSIGDYAFDLCMSMTSVHIPYGVKTIGDCAFGACPKLETVEIPYGVTSIGSHAFAWTGIEKVVIPATVSTIGDYAFQNCPNLTSIFNLATNPQTVNANVFEYTDKSKCTLSVPDYAYNNYSKPQWIEFSRRKIPTTYAVENSNYQLAMNFETGVLTLTGTGVLPDIFADGTHYYACDLYGNRQITQLSLPAGMTGIGEGFFHDLNSLTSVTIPDGVAIIKKGAFYACYSLESVTIPSNSVIIEDYAFELCYNLKTIYNYATVPQAITEKVFYDYQYDDYILDQSQCTLYVPKGSKPSYQAAAVWKEFKIEEMPALEGIETPSGSPSRGEKVLRNGMLLIERNGKTYTTSGTELR